MQLLDYEQVILRQMELLNCQGASLSYFAQTNKRQNLFQISKTYNLPNFSSYDVFNVITLQDHKDPNLTILSIAFLKSIFQKNNNSLLQLIKCSLYNKTLTFKQIPQQRRFHLSDQEIKKIFVQFFQLLTYIDEENKVINNLEKYSIMLTLFTIYFRVVLYSINMTEALNTQQQLQTKKIYLVLLDFFDVRYRQLKGIYLFLDDYVFMSIVNSEFNVGNFAQRKRKKSSIYYQNMLMDSNCIFSKKIRKSSKDINEENDQDLDMQIASLQSSTPSFVRINPQDQHFARKQIGQTSETNHNQQDDIETPSFARGQLKFNFQPKVNNRKIQIKQIEEFQFTTTIAYRKKSRTHHRLQSFSNDISKNEFSVPQQCSTPKNNNNKLQTSITYSQFSKKKQKDEKLNLQERKSNRAKFLQNLQKQIQKARQKNKIKYAFIKQNKDKNGQKTQIQLQNGQKQKKWCPIKYNNNKETYRTNINQIKQIKPNPFENVNKFAPASRIPKFIKQKKKFIQKDIPSKPLQHHFDELNSFYSTESYLLGQPSHNVSKLSFAVSSGDDYNFCSLKNSNQSPAQKRLVKTSAIYSRDSARSNFDMNESQESTKNKKIPKITFTYSKQNQISLKKQKKTFQLTKINDKKLFLFSIYISSIDFIQNFITKQFC